MKFAILSPFQLTLRRGIERVHWSLASRWAAKGIQVDILTWSHPNPVDWGKPPPGVCLRKVPYFRYWMGAMAVPYYFLWLLAGHYDWVFISFTSYGESSALTLLKAIRRPRLAVIFHFPSYQAPYQYSRFARSGLITWTDRLIGVSEHTAQGVQERFHRPCSVIPNGVDTDLFQPSESLRNVTRERHGIALDAPLIVTVAALEERKGIHWVMRALPQLLYSFPTLQYWVVGEGPDRQFLEAERHQLGLDNVVNFFGTQSDVVSYLAAADVTCLLSKGEALPLACLEYMAMARPILTSRHPPYGDLVKSAWGQSVDETDTPRVADALRLMLANPRWRLEAGQAGRQHVIEMYSWDRSAERYLAVLTSDVVPDAGVSQN